MRDIFNITKTCHTTPLAVIFERRILLSTANLLGPQNNDEGLEDKHLDGELRGCVRVEYISERLGALWLKPHFNSPRPTCLALS